MELAYWTNRVTLYSLCGSEYVRTGEFEGCFWKREDSLLYENGRRRRCRTFTVRIPEYCLIEPGDVLVLGACSEKVDDDFMKRHAGDAFTVRTALTGKAGLKHTRLTGVNIG